MHNINNILQREKVNIELHNIVNYPLTIVTAPMGYGKSTAVREYLLANQLGNIFISLNEASKNTGYFWTILIQRLSEIDKKLVTIMEGLGFPQDSMQTARFIDIILSYSLTNDFTLVFDDYQFAENEKLNDLLQTIIRRNVPKLHIVIISRHLPQISLTELIVKNVAYHIDKNILRFTDSDVRKYFANMSLPLSKEKVIKIQSIADGWVAALYLIYRGLKDGTPLENISEIEDLLKNALYKNYDDQTKKVLCALSILDEFKIELAVFSTELESVVSIIDKLYKENAFIHLDMRSKIYTIHNVFRSFLRNEFIGLRLDNKEIYRRAGYWYLERNDITQGFQYLFLGQDYDTMLKELEKPSLYIKASDRPMMFNYFDAIPESKKENHPIAYLKFILMFIITGDKKRGNELLTKFQDEISYDKFSNELKIEIEAAIYLIKVFLSFNNIELMISHTEKALDLLKGEASVISSYQGPFSFGSPHLTYIYYKEIGTYKKISELHYEKYAKVSGGAGLGSEALCAAEYALETGDFNSVEINAFRTIYQAKVKNQTSMVVCSAFTLARLYLYQNKYTEAISLLNELSDEVTSNIESILLNTFDLCLGYIYACTGEYDKIPKWIKDGDMSINSLLLQGAVFSYVVYGKALILSENWSKAEALCETFNSYFSIFNNQLGYIHNYIHLAIATYKRGNTVNAKSWLAKALNIGLADNIIMPFAENGTNILPILNLFSSKDEIDMEYINKLGVFSKKYSSIISNPVFFNNPLSAREIEVLKLISKGMSRNEIAEEMIISSGTVRTHIQNIYIKLGVNKKSEALNKALILNII